MIRVAFAGTFSASLEPRVRAHLAVPCEISVADEPGIVSKLAAVDVLVSLGFTREMGAAAGRLKLVQVPGAGLDRIDRAALLTRLLAVSGAPALSRVLPPDERQAPVLVIHFRRGETSLRLFTTLATLGTPHDVTLQEIRIECFFPVDDATARAFQGWAAAGRSS